MYQPNASTTNALVPVIQLESRTVILHLNSECSWVKRPKHHRQSSLAKTITGLFPQS
jgi:hypothetical protein